VKANAPALTIALCTLWVVSVDADCRAIISVSLGCLNVPGEGGKGSAAGVEAFDALIRPETAFRGVDIMAVDNEDMMLIDWSYKTVLGQSCYQSTLFR
jgi:hypothetical protein